MLMVLTTSAKGVSTDPTKPSGLTNPLLQFTDGLKTTASILIQSMNAPNVKKSLGAPVGGTTDLVIDDGRTNPDLLDLSGPYIYISVDARTAEQAAAVVNKAQEMIKNELDSRQKVLGAPRSTFITVAEVVPESVPEMELGGKWQAGAAAFVLTLAGSFGIAYGIARARLPKTPKPVVRPATSREPVVVSGWGDLDDVTATAQWRVDQLVHKPYQPPMITSASTRPKEEPRVEEYRKPVYEDDSDDDYTVVVVMPDGGSESGSDGASESDQAWVGGRSAQNGTSPDDHHRRNS
ncbi:hypothetical protein [Acrocarpospora catenulata]|uniref:hypothetical protein n=1 Tax=Acrocarpospora catenulata TaxID=2836182 RepID=UPI001BDA373A|nr:hypothetical protein [Acrocarpospora catenulata]